MYWMSSIFSGAVVGAAASEGVDWVSSIISWVIVGALVGAAIGGILKRAQFGLFAKLGIGMVGAAIGGGLFRVLGIQLGLENIQVSLENVKAKPLGEGAFEVRATVLGRGVFPVVTEMGRTARSVMPLRVGLGIARKAVLQGRKRTLLDDLPEPRALRWVIRGKPGDRVKIEVWTEKAGTAAAEVTL